MKFIKEQVRDTCKCSSRSSRGNALFVGSTGSHKAQQVWQPVNHFKTQRVSLFGTIFFPGIPGVFAAFVGIFIGSAIIKRWKLEPRHVQIMTAVAAVIGAASYFIVIGFGCEGLSVVGIHDVEDPYSM